MNIVPADSIFIILRYFIYFQQDDNMYAFLTVHETLLLAAHFFISSKKTVQELHDVVDAVINLLGLGKVRQFNLFCFLAELKIIEASSIY